MIKAAAACLAALALCAGCLTSEDLDCWYDDMCMSVDGGGASAAADGPARISGLPLRHADANQ